jgi:hypothetical protein
VEILVVLSISVTVVGGALACGNEAAILLRSFARVVQGVIGNGTVTSTSRFHLAFGFIAVRERKVRILSFGRLVTED